MTSKALGGLAGDRDGRPAFFPQPGGGSKERHGPSRGSIGQVFPRQTKERSVVEGYSSDAVKMGRFGRSGKTAALTLKMSL